MDKVYMIHEQCILRLHSTMLPTSTHKYIKKLFLFLYLTATCLDQPRGHLQGYKIQRYILTLYL